jgi:hypothetical protein
MFATKIYSNNAVDFLIQDILSFIRRTTMPVFQLEKYNSIVPNQNSKDEGKKIEASNDTNKEEASEPVITIKGTLAETVYDSIVALFSNYNKPQDVTIIATDENNIAQDARDVKVAQESSSYNTIDRHLKHIVFSPAGLEAFIKRIG